MPDESIVHEDEDDSRRIRHADPVAAAGFSMIPHVVMARQDLKPIAKLVYGYLDYLARLEGWRQRSGSDAHADVAPLQEEIASFLGVSVDSVQSSLRQLVKVGLLASKRRGLGRPNTYTILPLDAGKITPSVNRKIRFQETEDFGFLPTSLEVEARTTHSSDGEIAVSEDLPFPVPRKVGGKLVRGEEAAAACGVLGRWNALTGQRLSSVDWTTLLIRRMREHSELSVEDHEQVIRHTLSHPWWKDTVPALNMIYGSGAQFERSLMAMEGIGPPGKLTAVERLGIAAERLRERGE